MDRGAWWATVHGAAKSQTRQSTHAPLSPSHSGCSSTKLPPDGTWSIPALQYHTCSLLPGPHHKVINSCPSFKTQSAWSPLGNTDLVFPLCLHRTLGTSLSSPSPTRLQISWNWRVYLFIFWSPLVHLSLAQRHLINVADKLNGSFLLVSVDRECTSPQAACSIFRNSNLLGWYKKYEHGISTESLALRPGWRPSFGYLSIFHSPSLLPKEEDNF